MTNTALNFEFMKIVVLGTICIMLLASECKHHAAIPCENQPYLAATFVHSTLAKGRGQNLIIFNTFKGKKNNEYFIVKDNITGQYILKNATIGYKDNIKIVDTDAASYVRGLDKKLDSLGIREYDGQPDGLGTLMTLYMKNGDIIFKADTFKYITYPATLQQLRASTLLCDNWYVANE